MLINVCENIEDIREACDRIENIKNNLFSVHLKNIKNASITNASIFNCIKTALYFPNSSKQEIDETIEKLKQDKNGKKYGYLYTFTESSDLSSELKSISARGFK